MPPRVPLWHHRNLEILQNKMSMWLYSQRNLSDPMQLVEHNLNRVALSHEWKMIKIDVEKSFKDLDKEYLELSKSNTKST